MKTGGFVIKKGIPIPPSRGGSPGRYGGKPCMYPFDQMDIGDCFDAPRDQGVAPAPSYADRRQTNIKSHSLYWATRYKPGAKFATRIIDGSIIRCWRIA